MREKTIGVYFKLSPKEREFIEERMKRCKIQNMSAYIRKMCIDGYIVNLDVSVFDEIGKLLRVTANNINQIARQANINGEIDRTDIAAVNEQFTRIRLDFGEALAKLAKI